MRQQLFSFIRSKVAFFPMSLAILFLFIVGMPASSLASHTAAGAFVEDPALDGCNHCHNLTITAGNANGTSRRAAFSPANSSGMDPHVKRNNWLVTVSIMINKLSPATQAATPYLNTWYCTTCSCPSGIAEGQSCSGPPPPPPDTQPPSQPTNVQGTPHSSGTRIILTWNSSTDNMGVAGVQFLLDDNSLGVEDAASPYSISVNTALLSNGTHRFSARARDAAGNTATAQDVTVTVNNVLGDTQAPTV